MRVLLCTLFVFTIFCAEFASAGDLSNLSFSGNARVRGEGDDFTDFNSARNFLTIRIRPDFSYKADDQVDIMFEPQFSKNWGDMNFVTKSATTNKPQNTSGGANAIYSSYDTQVNFHQGYITYRPDDSVDIVLGRQILKYGDELILGAADWGNTGRSFDAARVKVKYGFGSTDLIYSKLADDNIAASTFATSATTTNIGDIDLYGIYNQWSFGAGLKAVDTYLLFQNDNTSGVAQTVAAVGARLKSDFADTSLPAGLDYRVEATKEYGSAVVDGDSAYQVDGELGYSFNLGVKMRIGAEYDVSGKNYNEMFPSPHQWLGYADMFGRRNLKEFVAHLKADLTEKDSIQFDAHFFSRTDTATGLYSNYGAAIAAPAASSASSVASEFDVTLSRQLTKSLKACAGGSLIHKGDYLNAETSKQPAFYYVLVQMSF